MTIFPRQENGHVFLTFYYFYLFTFRKGEVSLLHFVAVDGLEVVLHRDDGVAVLAPLGFTLGSLFKVGMVAHVIVGDEHEGGGAVFLIAQAVVVHGLVAAAVAEGEHGHLADLLADLLHLVGLEVLDEQTVGADEVFVLAHGVIDTFVVALVVGFEHDVHADDAVRLDADGLYERAADETVGTRDDIEGEAVGLEVVEDIEHGLVEALAVGHILEAVGGQGGVGLDVGIELGDAHAGVCLGGGTGVLHVEVVGQLLAVAHKVADVLSSLAHIVGCLVFVAGIAK